LYGQLHLSTLNTSPKNIDFQVKIILKKSGEVKLNSILFIKYTGMPGMLAWDWQIPGISGGFGNPRHFRGIWQSPGSGPECSPDPECPPDPECSPGIGKSQAFPGDLAIPRERPGMLA